MIFVTSIVADFVEAIAQARILILLCTQAEHFNKICKVLTASATSPRKSLDLLIIFYQIVGFLAKNA